MPRGIDLTGPEVRGAKAGHAKRINLNVSAIFEGYQPRMITAAPNRLNKMNQTTSRPPHRQPPRPQEAGWTKIAV